MKYRVFGSTMAIRFETGDELLSLIKSVCEKEGFTTATISGIGATDSIAVGAGDESKDAYAITEYKEKLEVLSLAGNVTLKEGKEFNVHLHASLA